MYDIYIMNYRNASGSLVTSERLLYSVPITQPDLALNSPVVKTEMGKTGSFEFGINPVHSYYNAWNQMKTVMRVVYDGTTIFRGRVLTIDNSPMTGEKKIHLEGDFAFFMDSMQEGQKEEDRSSISCNTYLQNLINNHNSQMDLAGESYKKIYLGEVPGQYSGSISAAQRITTESRKYGETNFVTTADALGGLQKEYGGYFRTRYVGGTCYLDWLDFCYNPTVNSQPIEISENLIDLNSTTEVDNLFTALIPVGSNEGKNIFIDDYKTEVHGSNKYILVPQIVSQFSDDELNRGYHSKADYQNAVANYGIIFKSQNFSNADTKEKLWNYAIDWIKNNYIGGISSFNITALDMHHVNGSVQKILTGDQVRVIYPNINAHTNGNTPTITKVLTMTSVQYDLYNPEKNNYSVGIPNSILSKTYGEPKKKGSGGTVTASESTAMAGGGGGYNQHQTDILREQASQRAWDYIVSKTYNNKEWQYIEEQEPNHAKAILTGTHYILTEEQTGKPSTFSKRLRACILNGPHHAIEMYPGARIPTRDLTDEQIYLYKKWGTSLLIDGENNLLTFSQKMDVRGLNDPIIAQRNRKLAELRADADRAEAGLLLWPRNKVMDEFIDPDKVKPSLALGGGDVTGSLKTTLVKLGLTADEADSLIKMDGEDSSFSLIDMANKGDFSLENLKALLTGKDGGNAAVGKEDGDPSTWAITLNRPITYYDEEGKPHTMVKSIHAADFHVDEIGSFKTKLGVFDQLIAARATIGELDVERARIGDLEVTTGDLDARTGIIEGSALWVNRNHITGVTGDFKIEKDSSGNDVLTIISGGGMKIERNNVAYGIYDNGNLTGGIMVDKINENTTVTKIKGDRVDIEAGQVRIGSGDFSDVKSWMNWTDEEMDRQEGLIAEKATIRQLNTQIARINSLETDYLKTSDLHGAIAYLTEVQVQSLSAGRISSERGGVSVRTVSADSFIHGGITCDINNAIVSATVSGNTLKLKNCKGEEVTFSKAVSSIDWSWSNGGAKAVVNPQGQTFYSPAYGSWTASGDPTYDKSTKLLKRKFIMNDENGSTMFSDDIMIPANIVEDQYKLADVWIQGTGEAVWIPVSSGGATYYAAESQQTLYEKGSSYTTVKGSGSWFYMRGSSVTPSKKTGNNRGTTSATLTYRKVYNSSGTDQGYHWVTTGTSGSSLMYSSGGAYTYYDVGSDSTLYKSGSYVHMYDAGDSVTAIGTERKITPISSTSIQVAPGVRYTQGTHYTDRYYTKS